MMKTSIVVLVMIAVSATVPYLVQAPSPRFTLLPPSIALTMFAGETADYQLKVHSNGPQPVTVRLSVTTTQFPTGGSQDSIILQYPATVVLGPGNTRVLVSVTVSTSAVPGTYILTNTIS